MKGAAEYQYERNGQGIPIAGCTGTAAALGIPAAIDRLRVTAIRRKKTPQASGNVMCH
ncbi:MAG: hypothetical protein LBD48_06110 [Treponema sp.]|jgi:hypothetical protein|nr:hypothetical protein [Treponema sp.]